MKILLTGDKGFVGSHIREALALEKHQVVGLEASQSFHQWCDDLPRMIPADINAVVHVGAIANNQCEDPNIFLWNSYATLLLAQHCRDLHGPDFPFIFFSTFQVDVIQIQPENASWYGWSKKYAEDGLKEVLPGATIFRPNVMWGDERNKGSLKEGSVPFRLASRKLKFLYTHWGRYYVHISDVIEAVKIALGEKLRGCFSLLGEYWWNKDLAALTNWRGYELIDNRNRSDKMKFNSIILPNKLHEFVLPPNWSSQTSLPQEFKKLESQYASHTG